MTRSDVERRLARELAAVLVFDPEDCEVTVGDRRRQVDICDRRRRLIIEYDGAPWHAHRESDDEQATAELAGEGWTVLRAREVPLAPVTDHDLLVYPGESIKRIAATIIDRLVDLGFEVPRAADYIADPQTWAASSRRAAARLIEEQDGDRPDNPPRGRRRNVVVSVPMEVFDEVREAAGTTTRSYTDLVIGALVQHEEALIREVTERAAQEVAHSPLAARARRGRRRTAHPGQRVQLTLYLTEDERADIDRLAGLLDISRSELVTRAILAGLADQAHDLGDSTPPPPPDSP